MGLSPPKPPHGDGTERISLRKKHDIVGMINSENGTKVSKYFDNPTTALTTASKK